MGPVNVNAIGAYIRDQREQAKISLRQLAQAAGVSNPYLSQIERGLRRPSADILQQIAKGLRISAEALYVEAGILEDRPAGPAVLEAVRADAELTERQKQMLIEIYESFRKEAAMAAAEAVAAESDLPVALLPGVLLPDDAALSWPDDRDPQDPAAADPDPEQEPAAGRPEPAAAIAGQPSGFAAGDQPASGPADETPDPGHPFPAAAGNR